MHQYPSREPKSFEEISRFVFENPQIAVETAEQDFQDQIRNMSEAAVESGAPIILLTGPSSSGKTTTANLLVSDLAALGRRAIRISLDDFYRDRCDMPLWEDGSKNFESVEGLDLECLHERTHHLLKTGHADFPVFDFALGTRSPDRVHPIDYDESTLIIYEGIHSLHPDLRKGIGENCFGIYIHPNTNFVNEKGEILLEARDLRLTRRILRDSINRGTPPLGTLGMWKDVMRGEMLYIRPNSKYADVYINTGHDYEPFLYCSSIIEMLSSIRDAGDMQETADRLIASFENFFSIDVDLVPKDSLIQEFISKN